jgi:hypothetical protein
MQENRPLLIRMQENRPLLIWRVGSFPQEAAQRGGANDGI